MGKKYEGEGVQSKINTSVTSLGELSIAAIEVIAAFSVPQGGTHEVSHDEYYGDCPSNPTGRHTWVRRLTSTDEQFEDTAYSTEWQVCVNCGAYFS